MEGLDSALDRALAASDAMAVILLGLAATIMWYRRVMPPPLAKLLPIKDGEINVESMVASMAVVLTALALRYAVNVGSLLGYWPQTDFSVDLVRMIIVYLVIAASMTTLRTATYPAFGNGATVVFLALAVLGGCSLYVWG